jgi:hypothetical protein
MMLQMQLLHKQITIVLDIANNETKSKKRLKAIQDINAISPKYLGNLTLHGTDKARVAIEKYNGIIAGTKLKLLKSVAGII